MDELSFFLVILSAFFHAMWNYLGERSGNGIEFLWIVVGFSILTYLPVWFFGLSRYGLSSTAVWFGALSGLFHVGYFSFLGLAYEHGDLSLSYPLLRGSSSILTPIFAMILLRERIDFRGGAGIALIVLGAFVISRKHGERHSESVLRLVQHKGSLYALLAGLCCAGYSLADKQGLSYANPLSYAILSLFVCFAIMGFLWRARLRRSVGNILKTSWKPSLLAGTQLSVVLLLIMIGLSRSKAAYVIPLRQISILFGVLLGVFFLRESCGRRRFIASALMLAGTILLALAR